jgi:NIMA (never in mitosis gene a)-related kinase 1/4/5
VTRVGWLLDVAKGLEHLHGRKIIHRDIKPENIMISRGRAKIGDLGIAKHLMDSDAVDPLSLGTYWYNSPEIFEGEYYGC